MERFLHIEQYISICIPESLDIIVSLDDIDAVSIESVLEFFFLGASMIVVWMGRQE